MEVKSEFQTQHVELLALTIVKQIILGITARKILSYPLDNFLLYGFKLVNSCVRWSPPNSVWDSVQKFILQLWDKVQLFCSDRWLALLYTV